VERERLAKHVPGDMGRRKELGDLAMGRDEFAQAIQYFQTAARLDPHEQAYQLNLEAARRRLAKK
jgi:predicted Zn-dependent protease